MKRTKVKGSSDELQGVERRPRVSIGGMLILAVRQLLQLTEEGTCQTRKGGQWGRAAGQAGTPPMAAAAGADWYFQEVSSGDK